jgi:uncharacterized membrane protein
MLRLIKNTLLWLAMSPAVFAQEFNYVRFDVPGALLTRPFGVNASGHIVGVYRDSGNAAHGFLRHPDGTYDSIDVPFTGATFTNAGGINGREEIVGRWVDAEGYAHLYLRKPDKSFVSFDPSTPCAPTYFGTFAHGINDAGDIVGRCFDSNGNEYGFLRYHRDGPFKIFLFPGAVTTDAWMITNGDVTGTLPPQPVIVGDYSDTFGFVHGFLWSPARGFITFDVGKNQTGVREVNERGEMTGVYGTFEVGSRFHGFLLRNQIRTTVDYPGSVDNAPIGGTLVISNNGLIVGGFIDADGNEHGFMATRCPTSGCR